jgi:DNA-binding CsgD family transcriptional regulator
MDPAIEKLSPKQRRVLELLLQGLGVDQVGQQLLLSPHSVRMFLQGAAEKLSMAPQDQDQE